MFSINFKQPLYCYSLVVNPLGLVRIEYFQMLHKISIHPQLNFKLRRCAEPCKYMEPPSNRVYLTVLSHSPFDLCSAIAWPFSSASHKKKKEKKNIESVAIAIDLTDKPFNWKWKKTEKKATNEIYKKTMMETAENRSEMTYFSVTFILENQINFMKLGISICLKLDYFFFRLFLYRCIYWYFL